MAGRRKRNPATGRLIRSGGVIHKCTCCCSTYYKATLCNSGNCLEWGYEVFICSNTTCGGDPIANGQVIGGTVGGQTYCFTVDTGTLYCGEETDGCEPLPPDAQILPPGKWGCLEDCDEVNCPPIEGYYIAVPCSCNEEDLPGTVYVSCSAYLASLGDTECPTWQLVIGETTYCVFVRQGSPATELPDPLDPDDVVITTAANTRNCCHCCGSRPGCCHFDFLHRTAMYNADLTITYEDRTVTCCGTEVSWEFTGSGSQQVWQDIGGGTLCPLFLFTWTADNTGWSGTKTDYDGNCGGVVGTSSSSGPISPCFSGFPSPAVIPGPGEHIQSGGFTQDCSGGTLHIVIDNTPGGGLKSEYIASYSVTSSAGICGQQSCEPLVPDAAPDMLRGAGGFR